MFIDCPSCEARTEAEELQSLDKFDPDYDSAPTRFLFVKCKTCSRPLLLEQYYSGYDGDRDYWSEPERLWPAPKREIAWHIPNVVKGSLEEAERCFRAKAFIACAVMCGRALEGICRHFKTKSHYLGPGLKELKDKEIIDGRLFKWSEELHQLRNVGAHANDEKISQEDAEDIIDFAHAISEYVFTLNKKYEGFMERKSKSAKGS